MNERLGLVEFLSDLRESLALARTHAVNDAAKRVGENGGDVLWLDVGNVTVEVEVTHEKTVSAEVSTEVEGKFWVFGSAKAGAKAGGDWSRSGTQKLTLTLTPVVQSLTKDDQGRTVSTTTSLKVAQASSERKV